jgi:two-component system, NarL family, sensor histidine kinase DesK
MRTGPEPAGPMPLRDVGRYGSMSFVPALAQGWGGRSDPQRIELYTRWSFYGSLAACPLLALMVSGAAPAVGPLSAAPFLVGSVVVAVAALLLARAGLVARRESHPLPTRLVAAAGVLAIACAAAGALSFSGAGGRDALPWSLALPLAVVLVASSTVWPARTLAIGGAGGGLVVAAGLLIAGVEPLEALILALLLAFVITSIAQSFRFTVWVLDVVEQLERTRDVQLQLAVAEERLRFARDLHDVMGRNLSAIAVKGQLAGELVRRGRPEAAGEVADISRIAEESLREVRGVVGGYRAVDVAGELAGARSVLRAAGVACAVSGEDDGAALPVRVQSTLGWVVRESVTNVLRHSRASSCSIDLETRPGGVELRVANDGLPEPGAPGPQAWGNGLTGLGERLAESGGRLTAGQEGDRFVLIATVPTEGPP